MHHNSSPIREWGFESLINSVLLSLTSSSGVSTASMTSSNILTIFFSDNDITCIMKGVLRRIAASEKEPKAIFALNESINS